MDEYGVETICIQFDPDVLDQNRPLILLDLDETLIHSFWQRNWDPDKFKLLEIECGIHSILTPNILEQRYRLIDVDEVNRCVVCVRPGVRHFLRMLYEFSDFAIWSAGGSLYVRAICDFLFPTVSESADHPHYMYPKPAFIWNNEMCLREPLHSPFLKLEYTKPLHLVLQNYRVDLSKVVLFDNRKENGFYYPLNLVYVDTWIPKNLKELEDPKQVKKQEKYLWNTCIDEIKKCLDHLHQTHSAMSHFPVIEMDEI